MISDASKDEIISFSARNVIHTLTPERVNKVEQSLIEEKPKQEARSDLVSLAYIIHSKNEWEKQNNFDLHYELDITTYNMVANIASNFNNEYYKNEFAKILVSGDLTKKYNINTKELLDNLQAGTIDELNKTLSKNHSTNIDELKSIKYNAIPKKELKDDVLNAVAKQEIEKIKREYGVEKDIIEQRSKKLFNLIPIPMWKETVKVGSERVLENKTYQNYVSNLNNFIKNDNGTIDDLKMISANTQRQKDIEETITKQIAHFQSEKIGSLFTEASYKERLIKEAEHNITHSSIYANMFKRDSLASETLEKSQRSKEPEKKTRQYDLQETIDGTKRAIEKMDTTVKAVTLDPKVAKSIELKIKAEQAKQDLAEKQQSQRRTQNKGLRI